MRVHAVTKYKFKDKEYNSLLEIKDEIINTIGVELLDEMQRNCPLEKHRDYEKLMDLICSPKIRKMLTESLNVEIELTDEDGDIEVKNILDVKK